jgi:hypothetical protein
LRSEDVLLNYPCAGAGSWTQDGSSFFYVANNGVDTKSLDFKLNTKSKLHRLGTEIATDVDFFSNQHYPELGIAPKEIPYAYIDESYSDYILGHLGTAQAERRLYYAPIFEGRTNGRTICGRIIKHGTARSRKGRARDSKARLWVAGQRVNLLLALPPSALQIEPPPSSRSFAFRNLRTGVFMAHLPDAGNDGIRSPVGIAELYIVVFICFHLLFFSSSFASAASCGTKAIVRTQAGLSCKNAALAQQTQLELAHRAFESQEQAVIEQAGIVNAIGINDQGVG